MLWKPILVLFDKQILREMDRGGQIFYIYNRVETIDQKVSELHELVPEARIGFVHGQMSEVMLENTLLDFLNGDYDILVATTIIETGIDIPMLIHFSLRMQTIWACLPFIS